MNISALTLRDLQYLVAVADHVHFGKAAAASNVSQPALSAQIRKIEDFLGIQVFERSSRRVEATPAGEAVISQARIVLEEAEKIADLTHNIRKPLTGELRLAAIATVGPYLMPHILAPLRKAYPNLGLFLREGLTEELLRDLKAGLLDAIIASDTFNDPAISVIPLFFEPFLLAAPPGHPLSRKDNLSSKDLRASEMVLLEDGHCLRDQSVDICPSNRRGQIRQLHATSLETLRHLVATGFGYTLIPQLAVADDKRLKTLIRYRPFQQKAVGRRIVLGYRSRFGRVADIHELAQFLSKHLPAGVAPVRT